MTHDKLQRWLVWAREIQAISQTGLTFAESEFDRTRYSRLMEIAAEIVQEHSGLLKEPVLDNFIKQTGYATPKIDVRGAIVRNDKILLVQEHSDKRWSMPGGWADVGDLPSGSIVREIWEESGFKAKIKKVVGVFDANRGDRSLEFYHAFKIIYLCEITGGNARTSNETLAVDFFSPDDLPPLSTDRTNKRLIDEVFAHVRDEKRQAAFD